MFISNSCVYTSYFTYQTSHRQKSLVRSALSAQKYTSGCSWWSIVWSYRADVPFSKSKKITRSWVRTPPLHDGSIKIIYPSNAKPNKTRNVCVALVCPAKCRSCCRKRHYAKRANFQREVFDFRVAAKPSLLQCGNFCVGCFNIPVAGQTCSAILHTVIVRKWKGRELPASGSK